MPILVPEVGDKVEFEIYTGEVRMVLFSTRTSESNVQNYVDVHCEHFREFIPLHKLTWNAEKNCWVVSA